MLRYLKFCPNSFNDMWENDLIKIYVIKFETNQKQIIAIPILPNILSAKDIQSIKLVTLQNIKREIFSLENPRER